MSLKLFTLDEIADLMQVSRRQVQRLVSSGRLRAVSFGGGLVPPSPKCRAGLQPRAPSPT